MGEDKALLPFSSYDTLSQYQFDRLKPYFKNIYISSKINKFDFLQSSENLILDEGKVFSPIVALQTILNSIKEQKVFIITVDTPLVSIESINQIIEESKNYEICVAQTKRTHNLCGVFSKSVLTTIESMLKEDIHKVGFLLKQSKTHICELENDDEFINLNEKEEYFRALKLI